MLLQADRLRLGYRKFEPSVTGLPGKTQTAQVCKPLGGNHRHHVIYLRHSLATPICPSLYISMLHASLACPCLAHLLPHPSVRPTYLEGTSRYRL